MNWALVIAFGLGVGMLVGMTGVGGGSLMTPLLILVLGTAPVTAIGTDLAYAAVTKTVGGWRHWKRGSVDLTIALWLAVGSIPGALGGVVVLHALENALGRDDFDTLLMSLVAGALFITGIAVLWRALFMSTANERETIIEFDLRHKVAAVTLGVSVGFVLGLTSAGSGALIAVGLILIYRLTPIRVVGTDVFHAALLLWVASIAHLINGDVDLGLAGNILIGSIPGVWIGSNLAFKLPENALRPLLGIVLLAAGMALLQKAGLDYPVYVIFLVPAAVAVLAYVLHRTRGPRTGLETPPQKQTQTHLVPDTTATEQA
ncbi:MAG TPA: sulfite exporter TauE/SafE family protein [Conexibacter sp.]|jgi:hypothetical protein